MKSCLNSSVRGLDNWTVNLWALIVPLVTFVAVTKDGILSDIVQGNIFHTPVEHAKFCHISAVLKAAQIFRKFRVTYFILKSGTWRSSPNLTAIFYAWSDERFVYLENLVRVKKPSASKPSFFDADFANVIICSFHFSLLLNWTPSRRIESQLSRTWLFTTNGYSLRLFYVKMCIPGFCFR